VTTDQPTPDLSALEPQVALSMPSELGFSPVEAVEDFISYMEGGSARNYAYDVDYGYGIRFTVDMADNPPTVRPTPARITESEHYPASDWQYEVANGDTRLGYIEWLQHKLDAE